MILLTLTIWVLPVFLLGMITNNEKVEEFSTYYICAIIVAWCVYFTLLLLGVSI
jgi:hypothetical protein